MDLFIDDYDIDYKKKSLTLICHYIRGERTTVIFHSYEEADSVVLEKLKGQTIFALEQQNSDGKNYFVIWTKGNTMVVPVVAKHVQKLIG